jgi:PPOX class probable F420-dependent enzyme
MAALCDQIRAVIDAPEFVTLATLGPDGRARLTVVWAKTDGDDILVSTTTDTVKYRDIQRDPRVSLLAYPKQQPYTYVTIHGAASATTTGGGELIQDLSQRYTGGPYTFDGPDKVRVVIRIAPATAVYSDPASRRARSKRRDSRPPTTTHPASTDRR